MTASGQLYLGDCLAWQCVGLGLVRAAELGFEACLDSCLSKHQDFLSWYQRRWSNGSTVGRQKQAQARQAAAW